VTERRHADENHAIDTPPTDTTATITEPSPTPGTSTGSRRHHATDPGDPVPATTPTHTRTTDLGLLVLRAGPGLLIAFHGAQNLLGWFGGLGMPADSHYFASMGYSPAVLFATISGITEMAGGLLLTLGLLTPLATAAVMGDMLNAVVAFHIPHGFIATGGDFVAIIGLAAIGIACTGPGTISLDHTRPLLPAKLDTAAFSIALGLGVGAIVLIIRALT
jgi:putative oxidoreductase